MFSPMFQEVKIVGRMGQPWSGVAPSGPAFMYQAQTTPPATLAPTPPETQPPSWDLEQNPPPQPPIPTSVPAQTPVLPPSPAGAALTVPATRKINTKYVLGGVAVLAFAAALLIPSNR